jgi:pimeloyl-ACP methyl ester carboxylesterase
VTVLSPDQTQRISTSVGALQVRTVGSGPPAVLWHSLFVDSTSWERVLNRLADDRQLILIDGPGHGDSGAPPGRFTLEDCAAAAVEILDALGVNAPVDWVGNAWGGHVGVVFAIAHPDRCRTLTAIGTPQRALNPAERRRIVPMVWAYQLAGPIRPLVGGVCDAMVGPHASPADRAVISTALTRAPRQGMLTAMRSIMLGRPNLLPVLATVRSPTLIVAAADGPMAPPEEARAEAARLPHSGFILLPGAGHVGPLLQSSIDLSRALTTFWRDPDPYRLAHPSAVTAN